MKHSICPIILLTGALALSAPVFADIVEGIESDPQTETSTPNGTNFDPPCGFAASLPLQGGTYLNAASNAYYLFGNGNVLDECASFGVSGHSRPNFLAWNCGGTNWDGSVPALPELIFFPTPQSQVSMNIGAASGGDAGIVVYDAGFNPLGGDSVVLTSALQSVSVDLGVPRISAVVIYGPCVMVADDIHYN